MIIAECGIGFSESGADCILDEDTGKGRR